MLYALRQCLLSETAEEAFDHIHPGVVRWSVVEMHPPMSQQPSFGRFIFVDVPVVQHDLKFAKRIGLHHISSMRLRESAVVRRSRTCDDYLAGSDLQSGQQRLQAVTG